MEYLPGGDVFGLLSKNNLPKSTIKLIIAETILAINYLHSINIIHHDIKPENILKEINNDYVVNSYYIFQDKKYYYFVMEYLPGGDVFTLLSKNNLPKKTIQLIVAETILAVNYLHSIHIIHHDIKPENILITLRGHFKLSDFGLSKSLQESEEDESMEEHVKNFINFVQFKNLDSSRSLLEDDDKNKDAVGTLNYMAPELFTDKYPQGGGVDYWAIGVLIFDLYSYSLPFEAKTQEETRENIIGLKIDWNKLINNEVKKIYGNIDSAVDLIKKFLKEDPKERWGDKNLDEIKRHKFFENFNWDDVQGIKSDTIKEYVKERVKESNNKIKNLILKNKDKKERRKDDKDKDDNTLDGYPETIEINLTENDERSFFTERLDNLTKKNNEIVKKKFQKEVNIEENISDIMLLDLE
jgi:serine/threonine protein kinase